MLDPLRIIPRTEHPKIAGAYFDREHVLPVAGQQWQNTEEKVSNKSSNILM